MIRAALHAFLPSSQPLMTRQSYAHEMVGALTMPATIVLVEAGVVGVVAVKAFNMGPALFAVVAAAPMFANLTSFMWSRLARGRRKVPFLAGVQIATLIAVALIALLPLSPGGAVLLAMLVVLARCLLAGVVTLRSTVWRHNYPRSVRASVTGRLSLMSLAVIAVAPLFAGWILESHTDAFRVVYVACPLVSLVGVLAWMRVRLRREAELLRFERQAGARPQPHGETAPIYEYDPNAPVSDGFWAVLRRDAFYRQYMLWQFIYGGANMMGETVLVYMIAQQTESYVVALGVTTVIPMVIAVLSLQYWAGWLDRMHVVTFRARHGWLWVSYLLMTWLGAWQGVFALIVVGRCLEGLARGGGVLAWNLGHNDFADRRLVAVYMGIHLTLTGIRGAIMPAFAMLLYVGWRPADMIAWLDDRGLTLLRPVMTALPELPGLGPHVFLVALCMSLIGVLGCTHLNRQLARQGRDVSGDD